MDWLVQTGRMDPSRVFVVGGSYGGYMALLLHGRHPERFQAVVDIFGPSDLFTFVQSVPDTWKPMMKRWLGDPDIDQARFIADSPITYVERMTRPMLVVQGANDPRVVKAESDQMVAALRDRGRTIEYLVLEDEGHGFAKKENEIRAYRAIADFLENQRKTH
ncbi:MAG: alpha/beta hydrolase family protein, partial [Sulfobacillus sp.]